MPFFLGNPGRQVQLPQPIRPHDPSLIRQVTVRQTIGGGQVANKAPGPGRRTYQLQWNWLAPEELSLLEEFYTDARGQGPHALLDPGRRNKLAANQSAAGAVTNDTAGFTVDATEALAVTTDLLYGSSVASMRWSLPDQPTDGLLLFDPPTGLSGVPAPAGQPWTLSMQLAGGGIDPTTTVTPLLLWYDATGQQIAVTAGTPVTVLPGVFQATSVTAVTPLGVAVRAALACDLSTVSAVAAGPGDIPVRRAPWTMPVRRAAPVGPLPYPINIYRPAGVYAADVLIAQPMLDMYNGVRTWVLGTGVPRVTIVALPETDRVLPTRDATATLVEVG